MDSGDHFEKTVYHHHHHHLVIHASECSNLWIELGLAYVMCSGFDAVFSFSFQWVWQSFFFF